MHVVEETCAKLESIFMIGPIAGSLRKEFIKVVFMTPEVG